ncbi:MAG: acyl carrier protein [Eubacteriaceae bacterium]|jgi:acyl carrier protein|nr:acyl carrier protein [Eubacteriaceae bacterium]
MEKYALIKRIVSEQLDVPEDELTEETDLVEDLQADSLDLLELVMAFEAEYGQKLPDEALREIKTIGDIINAIP